MYENIAASKNKALQYLQQPFTIDEVYDAIFDLNLLFKHGDGIHSIYAISDMTERFAKILERCQECGITLSQSLLDRTWSVVSWKRDSKSRKQMPKPHLLPASIRQEVEKEMALSTGLLPPVGCCKPSREMPTPDVLEKLCWSATHNDENALSAIRAFFEQEHLPQLLKIISADGHLDESLVKEYFKAGIFGTLSEFADSLPDNLGPATAQVLLDRLRMFPREGDTEQIAIEVAGMLLDRPDVFGMMKYLADAGRLAFALFTDSYPSTLHALQAWLARQDTWHPTENDLANHQPDQRVRPEMIVTAISLNDLQEKTHRHSHRTIPGMANANDLLTPRGCCPSDSDGNCFSEIDWQIDVEHDLEYLREGSHKFLDSLVSRLALAATEKVLRRLKSNGALSWAGALEAINKTISRLLGEDLVLITILELESSIIEKARGNLFMFDYDDKDPGVVRKSAGRFLSRNGLFHLTYLNGPGKKAFSLFAEQYPSKVIALNAWYELDENWSPESTGIALEALAAAANIVDGLQVNSDGKRVEPEQTARTVRSLR